MHAGARLGDEALLAHALREQGLADGVVDLVRAGVVEVLALEDDRRAAEVRREALADRDRGLASDIVVEDLLELLLEGRVLLRVLVRGRELLQRSHERLGHVLAAIDAEMSLGCHRLVPF